MSKYRLFSQLIVGVLWLILGAGCRKDPPEPSLGCQAGCCFDDVEVNFVQKLVGVEFDKTSAMYMLLKEPVNENDAVLVCPLDWPKYDSFPVSYVFPISPSNKPSFRYRLWGTLYENPNISGGFNPKGRSYWTKIDRIEKAP